MSELREQIKREIGRAFSWHTGVTFDEATDRILALFDKLDPQDCPTCRKLIEATIREMDKPETEPVSEQFGARWLNVTPPGIYIGPLPSQFSAEAYMDAAERVSEQDEDDHACDCVVESCDLCSGSVEEGYRVVCLECLPVERVSEASALRKALEELQARLSEYADPMGYDSIPGDEVKWMHALARRALEDTKGDT